MKFIRSIIAIVLSITLIICSTLPSLAQKNEVQESYVDSKIVEQLKADLGSEKTEKLLSKSLSVENNDFDLVTSDDETFGETNDTQDETTENLNSDMQVELADGVDDESENDSIRLENEEEPEEDMALAEMEYASEEDESLTETEEESEEDASLIEIEGDAVESTNLDKIEDNQTIERSEESAEGEENANNIENAKSTENTDASIIKSHNNLEEGNSKKSSGNVSDENDENSNVGNETTFENEDSVDIQVGGTGNIDNNTSKDSNNETITIDSANETNATLESNNELNDEDDKVATESGVQESISDSNLVATMSDTELKVATDSEALFGVDTPWMWWYLTDEGHTIHYTSTEPASGGNSVIITRYNNIEYTELEKDNIARAVFDNTINAQTCNSFFDGFRNLVEIDNISYLNTNNVTNFQGMFWGCSSLVNLDVSNFNTRNAIDMSSMFRSCISLTSIDLSNFDTRNVTDMSSMFCSCISLTSIDLSNFDTRNVTDMSGMFLGCSITNIDLSNFDTRNVTDMSAMFSGRSITSIDLSNFDTRNVTDMSGMFSCESITSLDLSNFDTRNVTDMNGMFSVCSSLTSLDLSHFNTSNVTDMSGMFENCSSLTSIDLSNFDTRNVTDMSGMFRGCSITNIDLSNFDTRNVTDMHEMFSLCSSLTIDVSSFNTENVTNMSGMFQTGGIFPMPAGIVYGDLTSIIGLQNFSTLNVTDMSNMFAYCAHIDSLDLSGFDTRKVTKIGSMFYHCSSLTTIYANEKFITTQVLEVDTWRTSEAMFSRCSALVGGNGTVYDSSHTDKEYARVDAAGTPGYFTYREPPAVTLESISIDTNPTKVTYTVGERFNPAGLKVKLNYSDDSDEVVVYNDTTKNDFSFNPSLTINLATSNNRVVVTYSGKTANIPITVTESGGGGDTPTPTTPSEVTLNSIEVVTRPTVTSYTAGNRLNPAGLVIKLNYSNNTTENVTYNNSTKSRFTFNPSLTTNLTTSHNTITITYGGKTTTFAISVSSGGSSVVPSGGSRGGSSGGGGGGGGMPAASRTAPETSYISVTKTISGSVDSATSRWVSDPITGKWKLNVSTNDGGTAPLSNGFYQVNYNITQLINNISVPTVVNNTYYFDESGNMVTGWIKTGDNKWFFFDNAKTSEEGKMAIGWKQVENAWYYFTPDGSMMENGMTPDGFIIGADGRWIQQ